MRAIAVTAMLAGATACTYPEKEFGQPFACLGDPRPASAPLRIVLRGAVVDAKENGQPLAGVEVTLLDENQGVIEGPELTDATGAYSFSTPTGGRPTGRVYLKAVKADRVTTYQTNPFPLTADLTAPFPVISVQNAASLAMGSIGTSPFPADKGVLAMNVLDCNGSRVAGAQVSTTPAGRVFYFDGVFPSMTRTATDAFGVALIADLTPGEVTLHTVVDGMPYPDRTFLVRGGEIVQNDVTPFTP